MPTPGTTPAPARPERSDAAANRQRILAAARELCASHGPDRLTVAAVAEAAGVGKATLIRRFGDKAGLIYALLDEHERSLQEDILRGPPPLGPGAAPRERILAFLSALLELSLHNLQLLHASETAKAGSRYRTGAYDAWQQHLTLLLREAGASVDPATAAHLLLSPFAAESLAALRADGHIEHVPGVLERLVDAVLADRSQERTRR